MKKIFSLFIIFAFTFNNISFAFEKQGQTLSPIPRVFLEGNETLPFSMDGTDNSFIQKYTEEWFNKKKGEIFTKYGKDADVFWSSFVNDDVLFEQVVSNYLEVFSKWLKNTLGEKGQGEYEVKYNFFKAPILETFYAIRAKEQGKKEIILPTEKSTKEITMKFPGTEPTEAEIDSAMVNEDAGMKILSLSDVMKYSVEIRNYADDSARIDAVVDFAANVFKKGAFGDNIQGNSFTRENVKKAYGKLILKLLKDFKIAEVKTGEKGFRGNFTYKHIDGRERTVNSLLYEITKNNVIYVTDETIAKSKNYVVVGVISHPIFENPEIYADIFGLDDKQKHMAAHILGVLFNKDKRSGVSDVVLKAVEDTTDLEYLRTAAMSKHLADPDGEFSRAALARIYKLNTQVGLDATAEVMDVTVVDEITPEVVADAQSRLADDQCDQSLEYIRKDGKEYDLSKDDVIFMGHYRKDRAGYLVEFFQKIGFEKIIGWVPFSKKYVEDGGKFVFPDTKNANAPKGFYKIMNEMGRQVRVVVEGEKQKPAAYNVLGKRLDLLDNEKLVVIPSQDNNPKSNPEYVNTPQMKTKEVADQVLAWLDDPNATDIFANLLSSDMMKHTGSFGSAKRGNEITDEQIGRIKAKIDEIASNNNYERDAANVPILVISADHGASESGIKGSVKTSDTSHTANKVPYIIYDPFSKERIPLKEGKTIVNNAATLLQLLGIDIPAGYAESLLPDTYKGSPRRMVFLSLDGWGINPDQNYEYDAIRLANTPNYDWLFKNASSTQLRADGEITGLRTGEFSDRVGPHHIVGKQPGTTDIGHWHLFSGHEESQPIRKVDELCRIDIEKFIAGDKSFDLAKSPIKGIVDELLYVKENNKKFHHMALGSEGGVHSCISHMYALMKLAKFLDLKKDQFLIHFAADGRDVPSRSAHLFVQDVMGEIGKTGMGVLVTVFGRADFARKDGFDHMSANVAVAMMGTFKKSLFATPDIDKMYSVSLDAEKEVFPAIEKSIEINKETLETNDVLKIYTCEEVDLSKVFPVIGGRRYKATIVSGATDIIKNHGHDIYLKRGNDPVVVKVKYVNATEEGAWYNVFNAHHQKEDHSRINELSKTTELILSQSYAGEGNAGKTAEEMWNKVYGKSGRDALKVVKCADIKDLAGMIENAVKRGNTPILAMTKDEIEAARGTVEDKTKLEKALAGVRSIALPTFGKEDRLKNPNKGSFVVEIAGTALLQAALTTEDFKGEGSSLVLSLQKLMKYWTGNKDLQKDALYYMLSFNEARSMTPESIEKPTDVFEWWAKLVKALLVSCPMTQYDPAKEFETRREIMIRA